MRKAIVAASVPDTDTIMVPGMGPKMIPAVMVSGLGGGEGRREGRQAQVRWHACTAGGGGGAGEYEEQCLYAPTHMRICRVIKHWLCNWAFFWWLKCWLGDWAFGG